MRWPFRSTAAKLAQQHREEARLLPLLRSQPRWGGGAAQDVGAAGRRADSAASLSGGTSPGGSDRGVGPASASDLLAALQQAAPGALPGASPASSPGAPARAAPQVVRPRASSAQQGQIDSLVAALVAQQAQQAQQVTLLAHAPPSPGGALAQLQQALQQGRGQGQGTVASLAAHVAGVQQQQQQQRSESLAAQQNVLLRVLQHLAQQPPPGAAPQARCPQQLSGLLGLGSAPAPAVAAAPEPAAQLLQLLQALQGATAAPKPTLKPAPAAPAAPAAAGSSLADVLGQLVVLTQQREQAAAAPQPRPAPEQQALQQLLTQLSAGKAGSPTGQAPGLSPKQEQAAAGGPGSLSSQQTHESTAAASARLSSHILAALPGLRLRTSPPPSRSPCVPGALGCSR